MKIVPVFLRYDYGIKSRSESLEYEGKGTYSTLKQITTDVYPFWYDQYLNNRAQLQKEVVTFIDSIKPDVVFFSLRKTK